MLLFCVFGVKPALSCWVPRADMGDEIDAAIRAKVGGAWLPVVSYRHQ